MVAALSLMVVAAGVIAYLFSNTLNEMRHSGDSVAVVQSLALARGGATLGNVILNNQVKEKLRQLVQDNPNNSRYLPYGNGTSAQVSSPQSVIGDLKTFLVSSLQAEVDTLLCNQTIPLSGVEGSISLRIHFSDTACTQALPGKTRLSAGRFVEGKIYAIPFVLISEAVVGKYKRNIVVQGEYQFDVGGGKFSKYALFTNNHELPDGTEVWFNSRTLFDGPVHTNQHFRFSAQPWFGGQVSSAGCSNPDAAIAAATDPLNIKCTNFTGAKFRSLSPQFVHADDLALGADTGADQPEFQAGIEYRASAIALPQNAFEQKTAAQNAGLYFPSNLYSLELYAANGSGVKPSKSGSSWTPQASFQYIKSCTAAASCKTYRYGEDARLYEQNSDGSWPASPLVSNFNGVMYAEGNVERFGGPERIIASTNPDDAPPALAAFSQITLVSTGNTRIIRDLKYEDTPCQGFPERQADGSVIPAVCSNLNAKNVLGIFTPTGDITIGNQNSDASLNAPDNITIHASLMSSHGQVRVENHSLGTSRGDVRLLGGIIEHTYGAFGTFNAATGDSLAGYGRRFTYDRRMANDIAPPFFPTTAKNDVNTVIVRSFSQQEQVY